MEIRRIHQSEGDTVGDLWDRMCREGEDGGPLTGRGRRNLSRMLAMSAWHRDAFCLVAVDGVQVIGFVNGRTGIGDGLLPGILGEIDSLYVVPGERDKGISRALAEAAVGRLRIRALIRSGICPARTPTTTTGSGGDWASSPTWCACRCIGMSDR